MRKVQFVGAGKVNIIECDTPTPNPGEVLVRVLRCALCGSDKRIWREGTANTSGHELVGTIEADAEKFYNAGNKAAGTRVRTGMQA